MITPIKTLQDIESEEQVLMAELTGLENSLVSLHDREWQIRTELTHLMIQRERMTKATEPLIP
jgi:hypothetical protein